MLKESVDKGRCVFHPIGNALLYKTGVDGAEDAMLHHSFCQILRWTEDIEIGLTVKNLCEHIFRIVIGGIFHLYGVAGYFLVPLFKLLYDSNSYILVPVIDFQDLLTVILCLNAKHAEHRDKDG